MGWMNSLYETYRYIEVFGDKEQKEKLLKIGHSTQRAHVEVELDEEGNFLRAKHVPSDVSETVIPVNEDSASRSSGIAPHPLFDKLKYLAGDYERYCGESNEEYHKLYMENLEDWKDSEFSSPKLEAVYKYLSKNSLISDLIEEKIFSVKDGRLTEKWELAEMKLTIGKQGEAFIRFSVSGVDKITALWQDKGLQDAYIKYYLSKSKEKKYCYVVGEELRPCINHPSKIRHSGDKAKLISSNDNKNGLTYVGRFENSEQAFTISYEASQMTHNALKWLIDRQGIRIGEKAFVLWGVNCEDLPNPFLSTAEIAGCDSEEELLTSEDIAGKFNDAILGYKANLNHKSKVVLLGVDAATTGRLAVIFNREYLGEQGNELIDNIKKWHDTGKWNTFYWNKENEKIYYHGIPSPRNIANFAFGTEQNGIIKTDDKLLANTVERILHCICDGKKIPRDIVDALINKSMYPQSYKNEGNWQQVLSAACSMYIKYMVDYGKGKEDMDKLDKELSYNCGRLLAVADAIERWALRDKVDDKEKIRATNAIRYYSRFIQKPNDTWLMLSGKLMVHREQLGERGKELYALLAEISDKIDFNEFENKRLNGAFCLGFDSQRQQIIDNAISKRNKKVEE